MNNDSALIRRVCHGWLAVDKMCMYALTWPHEHELGAQAPADEARHRRAHPVAPRHVVGSRDHADAAHCHWLVLLHDVEHGLSGPMFDKMNSHSRGVEPLELLDLMNDFRSSTAGANEFQIWTCELAISNSKGVLLLTSDGSCSSSTDAKKASMSTTSQVAVRSRPADSCATSASIALQGGGLRRFSEIISYEERGS